VPFDRNPNRVPDKIDRDEEREPDQSHLVHVPRIYCTIQNHGLLHLPPPIVERLAALGIQNAQGESHLGHSETLTAMTDELIEGLGRFSSLRRIQSGTRDLIVTAAAVHDIGKTGPPMSINPDPIPFVKFYNVDFPNGAQKMMLRTALHLAIQMGGITTEERNYIEKVLRAYGLAPDRMYLRTFYNLHSLFTYDILREGGTTEDIAAAASGHHLKRGVKPDSYSFGDLAETGRYIEPLDELAAMVRKNNLRTRNLSTRDRIQAVYLPFETLPKPISSAYCGTLNVAIASGVLPDIVERHPSQKS